MSALLAATAVALAATWTNTETVHGLAAFGGRVVACTEGGLDLFLPGGEHERTLRVEHGLPSHFCRALRPVGESLFVATDEGVAELGSGFEVRQVLSAIRWHALPSFGAASPSAYRLELESLAKRLPAGATWSAFSAHHAASADGRIVSLSDGSVRAVPGYVLGLSEGDDGLRIVTTESLFLASTRRLEELSAPPGPLGHQPDPAGGWVFGRDGARRWRAGLEPATGAPRGSTARLELDGAVWFGTRDDGVHRDDGERLTRRTPRGQLCGNHVVSVTRYRGRLVVGTFDRGACWLSGGRWAPIRRPALPSDHVFHVASDEAHLYVSTSHGLGYFDGRRWTQYGYSGRNPIGLKRLSVVATLTELDGGPAVVDGRGVSFIRSQAGPSLVRREPLPEGWSEHVSAARGAGRFVWVGSEDRGLARYDGERWVKFHDGKDLTDNWVMALSVDASGRAAVGSCLEGFSYFDGQRWTRVRDAEGLPSKMIVSTALVPGGALVGTLAGAVRYDAASGRLARISGLPDPRVHAIHVEGAGAFFGTEGGLAWVQGASAGSGGGVSSGDGQLPGHHLDERLQRFGLDTLGLRSR